MSDNVEEVTLQQDADFSSPLRRVAYEAGMLLGLEATRDEQSYHRQRLNRHQYWLHGSGTLAGMVVAIDPASSGSSDPVLTRMTVSPGIGIDGLGREVQIHEAHCINLGEWLQTRTETQLREGYDEAAAVLWLKVTVRYQPCAVALQPVLARKLNLSTDAVQPARTADSILLELAAELPPAADDAYRPWAVHTALDNALPALNQPEEELINAAAGNLPLQRQLQLHARLLHALDDGIDPQLVSEELEREAQLLLAHVAIDIADLNTILDADSGDPVVNPNAIRVNNLVRPFLVTASQLAYLQRTA